MKKSKNYGIVTNERIFAMIDQKEFEECFISWIKAVNQLTKKKVEKLLTKTNAERNEVQERREDAYVKIFYKQFDFIGRGDSRKQSRL